MPRGTYIGHSILHGYTSVNADRQGSDVPNWSKKNIETVLRILTIPDLVDSSAAGAAPAGAGAATVAGLAPGMIVRLGREWGMSDGR